MQYFYKDNNDLFHVGNEILPSGKYSLKIQKSNSIVSLVSLDGEEVIMAPIEVTKLLRENGSSYNDLDTFLNENGDFFTSGLAALSALEIRVAYIEDTETKVLYYEEIDGGQISGQISIPTNTQILFNQWQNGVDAVVTSIEGGVPTYQDTGIDVLSLDSSGNYTLSGTLPTNPAAFIFYLSVPLIELQNLDKNKIIDQYLLVSANSESLENVISVALSGGDYTSIKEAVDSIPTGVRTTIRVAPGTYTENNPITVPQYCTIEGIGKDKVRVEAANVNNHLFILETGVLELKNLIFLNVTGAGAYAVYKDTSNSVPIKITDCLFSLNANGLLLNNSGGKISLVNCGYYTNSSVTIDNLFTVSAGVLYINGFSTFDFVNRVNNLFVSNGSDAVLVINNTTVLNSNIGTIARLENGGNLTASTCFWNDAEYGIYIGEGDTEVDVNNLSMKRNNIGLHVAYSTTTNPLLSLFSTVILDSSIFNIDINNVNTIITGNGSTQSNKMRLIGGVKLFASFIDIIPYDEGLNVFGELHVGTPFYPTESCLGEGDSYSDQMLIYEWDGTNWTNVTDLVKTIDGTSYTLSNGNIDSAVYMASTYRDKYNQFIKHFGVKMNISSLGNNTNDIEVTGTCSPDVTGGYNDRLSDFNGNKVYIRRDSAYYIFFMQSYWCINDLPPEQTDNYFNSKFIAAKLETTYSPVGSSTGNPIVQITSINTTPKIIIEYYNSESAAWEEVTFMNSDSDSPYVSYANHPISTTGSHQVRYNYGLRDASWGKNDPMGLGVNYYWIRWRIISQIEPSSIDQIKIHSNRMEVNSDGWVEYFGTSRPIGLLPWFFNLAIASTNSPANADIFLSDKLHRGGKENRFQTGVTDSTGFSSAIPLDCDTSTPILIKFSYFFNGATQGIADFTIRWGFAKEGDNIYTGTAGAPPTWTNEKSKQISLNFDENNKFHWFEFYLDISDMLPRRVANFPDVFFVNIERDGSNDTLDGDVVIPEILAYYLKWNNGGHI